MNGEPADNTGENAHGRLHNAWTAGSGIGGRLSAVNHKVIGMRFVVTGLFFFLFGGVLALLMRLQLVAPENSFVSVETFNELFTMHGTTMMFLFAVPILEGLAMYLLPLILGTRDLPFPRLNAFGYWCYLFGGLLVISSLFIGDAPSEGWFAYPPLSGPEFAPGPGMDIWLLGITFVEISAVAAAIEILVAFFCRRAPGMSLSRVPIFGWAMMVTAAMIAVAFPVLMAGSVLLEIERLFGLRLFDATAGGDPLLWQHLFWFFGHPEVYIIFVPAVGVVSTVVPVFSRRPLAGYPLVVAALIAIGLLSFGLWVHHMFTTGLSLVAMSFFAVAGFLIAIPSAIQVFAWLVTMWKGKPEFRAPLLFVLGFLQIFILGGITGVMVSAVPFDWAVHDSYFVVAHFHYVLIGGMVFPLFGGLYYWFPKATGRMLSENLGTASFWTMLIGFNVAFFPQHIAGLEGMPRRVYSYTATDGWEIWNVISTIGAFIFAIGVLLTIWNMVASRINGRDAGPDPWHGAGLEWAVPSPPPAYNFRRPPVVYSVNPMWDPEQERPRSGLTEKVADELSDIKHHVREVFETSAVHARPISVALLPGPTYVPLIAAGTLFVSLIGVLTSQYLVALAGGVAALVTIVIWAYRTATAPDAGLQRSLPVKRSGSGVLGVGFAMLPLVAILGSMLFAYLNLASHNETWPPSGVDDPGLGAGLAAVAVAVLAALAGRFGLCLVKERNRWSHAIPAGVVAILMTVAAMMLLLWLGSIDVGRGATASAYGSITTAVVVFAIVVCVSAAVAAAIVVGRMALTPGELDLHGQVALRVLWMITGFAAVSTGLVVMMVWLVPILGGS